MLRRSGYRLPKQDPVTLSHGTWEGYVTAARPLPKSIAQIEPEGADVGLLHNQRHLRCCCKARDFPGFTKERRTNTPSPKLGIHGDDIEIPGACGRGLKLEQWHEGVGQIGGIASFVGCGKQPTSQRASSGAIDFSNGESCIVQRTGRQRADALAANLERGLTRPAPRAPQPERETARRAVDQAYQIKGIGSLRLAEPYGRAHGSATAPGPATKDLALCASSASIAQYMPIKSVKRMALDP
jgi:hypothetical protein